MATNTAEISSANVALIKTEPTRRVYSVSLSGERLKSVEARWLDLAKQNLRLPGFRKGHTPADVVVGQMGDWLKGKILEEFLRTVVGEIIAKDKLKIVSSATVDKVDYKLGEKIDVQVLFSVEPEFSVTGYTGLSIRKHMRHVKEEDVEKELHRLIGSQNPVYLVPADNSAKEPLWALANLKLTQNSAESVWSVEGYLTPLSEECLPFGFKAAVNSMKPGETKEISVDLDDDCPVPALRGKKGKMQIELLEIKKQLAGESTAASALEIEESKLQEIRGQIRKGLEERLERRARKMMEDQIVAELLEANELEVADPEIEHRMQELLHRARGVLSMSGGKGLSPEHEAELRVKYRIEAANDVRFSYIAREIAKREKLEAKEEDYTKQLESVENQEEKTYMEKNKESVLYNILMEKVFDFLISKANTETVEV